MRGPRMMHDTPTLLTQIIDDLVGKNRELEDTVKVLFECLVRAQRKLDEANRYRRVDAPGQV
jgi:hypothetical protein